MTADALHPTLRHVRAADLDERTGQQTRLSPEPGDDVVLARSTQEAIMVNLPSLHGPGPADGPA